jgi:hypothetical protein
VVEQDGKGCWHDQRRGPCPPSRDAYETSAFIVAHIEEALYFSTVSFSTIGFGDVVLSPEWRMFSSLEGINGFLLIGWSTAYLVAASTRHGPFRLGEHF